jgi:hypothetical protein
MQQRKTPIWGLSAIVILGVGGFFLGKEMISQPVSIENLESNYMMSETLAIQENNQDILMSGKAASDFNNVAPAAGDNEAGKELMEAAPEMDTANRVAPQDMPVENDMQADEATEEDTAADISEETAEDQAAAASDDTEERLSKMEENDDPLTAIRAIGDPNAPVIMEDFSSLTCPHCAHFHEDTLPLIKEQYVDTGKVYLIFRDYPLNKPAVTAAGIARCMPEDEYYDFITVLFRTQMEWATSNSPQKLVQTAKLAGLSDEELKTCMENRDLIKYILATMKHNSQKYEISSTPTFVLNEGKVTITGNRSFEEFASQIDALLADAENNAE